MSSSPAALTSNSAPATFQRGKAERSSAVGQTGFGPYRLLPERESNEVAGAALWAPDASASGENSGSAAQCEEPGFDIASGGGLVGLLWCVMVGCTWRVFCPEEVASLCVLYEA